MPANILDPVFATKWWHVEGERLVCDLCPRECRLSEGQRGFCFVRQNVGGRMALTTYGRSTGFCIDPIEKKPLNHFLPGTPVLSFGTAGCNLGCKFCQNWDISKSREIEILSQQAGPEAIVRTAKEHGCRSIAFTYNDPVIWAEYAIDTAKVARAEGIKTVAVTAGYITPQARGEFYEHMDAANVDLKAFTDEFYRKQTFSRIEPVLDTLRWLKHETNVWFEITNLMIPGENDAPEETARLCDWVLENVGDAVPVHFTAFHPDFKMRDKSNTPHETLIAARQIAIDRGLKFVYVGNVLDGVRQSTYCPGCAAVVIERDHYEIGQFRLRDGACADCGTAIPGVFENEWGHWGRKRIPLSIRDTETPKTMTFQHPEARRALIDRARHLVDCAARGATATGALPAAVAAIPCHGLFVTLKRGHHLRGCIGSYQTDAANPVGALLDQTAPAAALNDWRFPPIGAEELPFLSIEITPMHGFRSVVEKGPDRAGAVTIGTHGLIIRQGERRGLLLPQVAVENGWDAPEFLDQVCAKAGLPPVAWQSADSDLTTFEGEPFSAPSPEPEIDATALSREEIQVIATVASALLAGSAGTIQIPNSLIQTCAQPLGVILESGTRQSLALRAGASLVDLLREAAQSIAVAGEAPPVEANVHLLSMPVTLRPADYPGRHGSTQRGAVLARLGEKFAVSVPAQPADSVPAALNSIGLTVDQWAASGAEVIAFQKQSVAFRLPSPADPTVRPAARSGQFYPASNDEIRSQLDAFFAKAGKTAEKPARAVMLPHAGWNFCGDLVAGALAGVRVPEFVVVIGPKHTPHGANWSVSASSAWQLPGLKIPVAADWADFLVQRCPGLVRETDAHREEHGCEVLLPFLHRKNPNVKIVPIAIGAAGFDDLAPLADALAALRTELRDRVLLVISSDMNHFASDTENRRRDKTALAKFKTGDARGLFDLCLAKDISMCGLRPAVAVLRALKKERALKVKITGYDTSARVSGDASRVVGYAGATIQ